MHLWVNWYNKHSVHQWIEKQEGFAKSGVLNTYNLSCLYCIIQTKTK